jgi:hypothetical protein
MKTKGQNTVLIIFLMWTFALGSSQEIENILNQPEDKIDIGYAFLVLSKDANYDIKSGMKPFDIMTKRMNQFLGMVKEDAHILDNRIRAMNTFLFREGPWNNAGNGKFIVYEYDLASIDTVKPEALFLVHALTALKGTCSSLPMFGAVIADKLGWPVKAVRMPGHIFLRYEGAKHENIDPSAYGGFVPDSQYIKDFKVSTAAIKNCVYMRSLSKMEFISTMLVNNVFYSMQVQKDTARAVQYLQIAIAADSSNADAYSNLALISNDAKLLNKDNSMDFQEDIQNHFCENNKKV